MLDFNAYKLAQFDQLAAKIKANPELYLQFDSVSDFYKSAWLDAFPVGTTWACSGLDDGAEQFDAVIQYKNRKLSLSISANVSVHLNF